MSTSAAACVLMRLDFGQASSSGVRRFGAVVGSPATPTPSGLFAIYAKARQPVGSELGPWALHLTGHSDVLFNCGGGPGRVAIHGRAGDLLADPIGTARSHGCVRVQNGEISWLAAHVSEVPAGPNPQPGAARGATR